MNQFEPVEQITETIARVASECRAVSITALCSEPGAAITTAELDELRDVVLSTLERWGRHGVAISTTAPLPVAELSDGDAARVRVALMYEVKKRETVEPVDADDWYEFETVEAAG